MPTDPQTVNNYDATELMGLLREVEEIITSEDYNDIVWAGDMNWEMTRKSQFSCIMKSFVEKIGLVSLWNHHKIDFTHMHTDNKSVTSLDHFLISPRLLPLITGCGVIHRGDNMSRHSPIWLKLNLGSLPKKQKASGRTPIKPSWPKATPEDIEAYSKTLKQKLEVLSSPQAMKCTDRHCSDPAHSKDRDTFMLDILLSMVETSHTSIPLCGGRRVGSTAKSGCKAIPGWTEEVEPFRMESMYWQRVWLAEGRPSHGWLHATMVKKRTQYHYAVRRLKRKADLIRAGKLFVASMESDLHLLKEMKAIKGGNLCQTELPDTVGGANGQEEVVEKFKEVYSLLYNSAESESEICDLMAKVTYLIQADSLGEIKRVTAERVKEAVGLLKPRKGDVSGGFTSDALINAPDILFEQLASIFQRWLIHGTVTLSLLTFAGSSSFLEVYVQGRYLHHTVL